MRHAVGRGRLKTLFVDLHVTGSRFHSASKTGANGSGWNTVAGTPTSITLLAVSPYSEGIVWSTHFVRSARRAGMSSSSRWIFGIIGADERSVIASADDGWRSAMCAKSASSGLMCPARVDASVCALSRGEGGAHPTSWGRGRRCLLWS
jgi:hypothetical protein